MNPINQKINKKKVHLNITDTFDFLEEGFTVEKKRSFFGGYIERTYHLNVQDETLVWNSEKKIFKKNSFPISQIWGMDKIDSNQIKIELFFTVKHEYHYKNMIYKTIYWRCQSEELRNKIFESIEILKKYQMTEKFHLNHKKIKLITSSSNPLKTIK